MQIALWQRLQVMQQRAAMYYQTQFSTGKFAGNFRVNALHGNLLETSGVGYNAVTDHTSKALGYENVKVQKKLTDLLGGDIRSECQNT